MKKSVEVINPRFQSFPIFLQLRGWNSVHDAQVRKQLSSHPLALVEYQLPTLPFISCIPRKNFKKNTLSKPSLLCRSLRLVRHLQISLCHIRVCAVPQTRTTLNFEDALISKCKKTNLI